jgi:hypothetical protein
VIDTSFDFRTDSTGPDPDKSSPTLRRYHRELWSKPLPNGTPFELDASTPGTYLHHSSNLGEFFLSSDSIIQTFSGWESMQAITRELGEVETEEFLRLGYTMGGMMVFPAYKIDGYMTINGARGFHRSIADRFDLTLECIRRHYKRESSPLQPTLARYSDFFSLFGSFAGYVDFFLLDDLVTADGSAVTFFMPFNDFAPPAVPRDVDTYRRFRDRSMEFTRARNLRIDRWVAEHRGDGAS